MAEDLGARSQYLTNAAHLLAATSPAATSFLGQARTRLLDDADIDMPERQRAALRREVCGACGNLMIPGWSCKVSNVARAWKHKPKDKTEKRTAIAAETNVVYTCLRCARQTSQAQQRHPRRSMKTSKSTSSLAPSPSDTLSKANQERMTKTINASSKQRQKARKGGLQAMLEKSKTQQSNSSGLDLLDFAM